jgi:hypothetical protein
MSEWYERVQGATSNVATANGEAWDAESIETVIAFTDDVTDEELAITLGRTLAAVWNIQHRLRSEGVDTVRRAYAPNVLPTCATHHIALTATGECDWW